MRVRLNFWAFSLPGWRKWIFVKEVIDTSSSHILNGFWSHLVMRKEKKHHFISKMFHSSSEFYRILKFQGNWSQNQNNLDVFLDESKGFFTA